MSVTNPPTTPTTDRPAPARYLAAGIAAGIGVLYVALFLALLPHLRETDNPAPVFLVLAVVYAAGALLVLARDSRVLHLVGVGVQVFLVAGYVWLWASSASAGDDAFFRDHLALGLVITAAQVVLAVLLVLLARSSPATPGRDTDG